MGKIIFVKILTSENRTGKIHQTFWFELTQGIRYYQNCIQDYYANEW